LAKKVVGKINEIMPEDDLIKVCHVCGTHEYVISRHGLRSLLPKNLEVIAGPGCPVCVTPSHDIDEAILLANNGKVICTYGDMMVVPATQESLSKVKAKGADVKVVYSPTDAVKFAKKNPDKEVIFFSLGFETTAPATVAEILNKPPENFSVLTSHRLIPPAMELLMGIGDIHIDGFLCPGHVATIIGVKPFKVFADAYAMPAVVAGFEPDDVLLSLFMMVRQIYEGKPRAENEYTRCVSFEGNLRAQEFLEEVFDVVDAHWRGIGKVPYSGYALKKEYEEYDARKRFESLLEKVGESRDIHPGCSCHNVMLGKIKPTECKLFMKACTPQSPYGPCMVSMEGTCAIYARYGKQMKTEL